LSITCCLVIVLSLVFAVVYDSLESPLYTLMIAIGLLNRQLVGDVRQRWDRSAEAMA
jgi:hypothetical protein